MVGARVSEWREEEGGEQEGGMGGLRRGDVTLAASLRHSGLPSHRLFPLPRGARAGLCVLCPDTNNSLLVFPGPERGQVQLVDLADPKQAPSIIAAHETALQCIALNLVRTCDTLCGMHAAAFPVSLPQPVPACTVRRFLVAADGDRICASDCQQALCRSRTLRLASWGSPVTRHRTAVWLRRRRRKEH